MAFPESQRVIYEVNPLEEVICQLRFPPILRIDSETPAAFQERVRKSYPLLREKKGLAALGIPPEIAKIIPSELPFRAGNGAYEFVSEDEANTLSLIRDFLAFSIRKYERWEKFRQDLELPFRTLMDEYAPVFFSRTGLRYRNVIRRSALNMEGTDWSALLRPHVSGELASPDMARSIDEAASQVVIRLDDELGRVRLQHGLAESTETGEICYVIDSDFFTEQKTEITDAFRILDAFNRQAAKLFRWCITDILHEAMRPEPI
jgi:uncharacterized protein (TIGR04255 family)